MAKGRLIDRLSGADPGEGGRRWALPTWAISAALHAAIVFGVGAWTLTVPKSLPAEKQMDVGIMLRSESDSSTIYETTSERFEQPRPEASETPETDPLEDLLRDTAADQTQAEPAPDVELLATAGQAIRQAQPFLPKASMPLGGGKSRTRFFAAEDVGTSFVWVIDRSASMSYSNAIELAKREVVNNLGNLDEATRFQVFFYHTEWDAIQSQDAGLLKASRLNIEKTKTFLQTMTATGGTDHNPALLAAFRLQPEVIYFLTDGDQVTQNHVRMLTAANRKSRPPATIHVIEFGSGASVGDKPPLRELARRNDGTYSYVNVESVSPPRNRGR